MKKEDWLSSRKIIVGSLGNMKDCSWSNKLVWRTGFRDELQNPIFAQSSRLFFWKLRCKWRSKGIDSSENKMNVQHLVKSKIAVEISTTFEESKNNSSEIFF